MSSRVMSDSLRSRRVVSRRVVNGRVVNGRAGYADAIRSIALNTIDSGPFFSVSGKRSTRPGPRRKQGMASDERAAHGWQETGGGANDWAAND
jgi:hypothetical protein